MTATQMKVMTVESSAAVVANTPFSASIIADWIAFCDVQPATQKTYDKAVKALAHDAYFRYCRYLLPEETLTEEEVENINYLYESYHALGLNSTGDKLYQEIIKKPVKTKFT